MQGKTLYTILLSIIAVMALALAVLIVVLFTTFYNSPADPGQTRPPLVERAVPSKEQAEYKLYDESEVFKLKNKNEQSNAFIQTSVSIIFDGGKKNRKLEKRTALIEKNVSKLKQATVKYFLSQGFEDLATIENSQEALQTAYNEIISQGAEDDDMIIIDVIMIEWKPIMQ